MAEENILDSDINGGVNKLSNYQLVGILLEKVNYPDRIKEEVEIELYQRNITTTEIASLKKEYLLPVITNGVSVLNQRQIFLTLSILLIGFFFYNFLIILVGATIIVASLVATNNKFENGLKSELKVWKVFRSIYLLLILIVLLIGFII